MAELFYPDYIGFVGTTSTGGSQGIYRIGLHAASRRVQILDIRPMYNAGYLTLSKDKRNLYVLSEGMTFQGQASGGITAYDVRSGRFDALNHASTGGQRACFVCCDDAEGEIYVSNFFNGTLSVYQRSADGSIGAQLAYVAHPRADHAPVGPKLHCVVKSPAGRYAVSLELAGGRIFLYDCQADYRIIWTEEMPKTAGPRHLTISEDGRFLYVNRQRDSMVSVYALAPQAEKKLALLQQISVRSKDMVGKTEPAAIRLSSSGRLLAVSNRGMGTRNREDSIALFSVDQASGLLTPLAIERTGGEMPRDFNFTPDGRFLVVGYQFQNYLDVYEVTQTGLIYAGNSEAIPSPVCIAF